MSFEVNDCLITFVLAGNQTVGTNKFRAQMPFNGEVTAVTAVAGTGPTGTGLGLVYDVNVNGTTIFTTQAQRPMIDIGDTFVDIPEFHLPVEKGLFNYGDILTVDCDVIGSTVAGADVTVCINVQKR